MNTCPFCYTEGCPRQEAAETGARRLLPGQIDPDWTDMLMVCALNRIAYNLEELTKRGTAVYYPGRI